MKKHYLLLPCLLVMIFFAACNQLEPDVTGVQAKLNLPEQAFDYEGLDYPDHFLSRFNFVTRVNPDVTNDGATLGRVLFYDNKMSLNNSVACASCHHQSKGFADGAIASTGFGGKVTPRNSLSIANGSISNNLFWDSRVNSLKDLILEPIQNHIEMGMEDVDMLTTKLAATDYYPALFEKAYGDKNITADRISDAMAQFLGSMKSVSAKYDVALSSNNFSEYSSLENLGKEIFFSSKGQCSACHAGANFSSINSYYDNNSLRGATNIGLDPEYSDKGIENGRFRIPSLRNVALTAPYMHDGRYETLEEVVDFYDHGIKDNPNLDVRFRDSNGEPIRMDLTSIEKKALVAFMNTLTDETFINDEKFSNPFN